MSKVISYMCQRIYEVLILLSIFFYIIKEIFIESIQCK